MLSEEEAKGLNPCCNGIYLIICEWYTHTNLFFVLILVVMEYT